MKLNPITRLEYFLAKIAGRKDIGEMKPLLRKEFFLNDIAKVALPPAETTDAGKVPVVQENGSYSLVKSNNEFPANPSANGTYTLKATVSDGTVTLAWVADAT